MAVARIILLLKAKETSAQMAEEPREGEVLRVGAGSPSPPARRSGERYRLPQRGPGRALAAEPFSRI